MSLFVPRKVLVTGGAGFIGSNFIRFMLAGDADVSILNLDKLTYAGSRENLQGLPDAARHELVVGDICDRELVDGILRRHEVNAVVHFAPGQRGTGGTDLVGGGGGEGDHAIEPVGEPEADPLVGEQRHHAVHVALEH